jgi:acylphosphatase
LEQLHCFVHGRVQGVGFRAFVLQRASSLNLTGWCRNLGWDQVEVLAEGDRTNLEILLRELQEGPSMAFVEKVDTTWASASGELGHFRVR